MYDEKHVKMVALKGKSNWHYWKGRMIDYLFTKDLYDPILGPPESTNPLLSATPVVSDEGTTSSRSSSPVIDKGKTPLIPPLPTAKVESRVTAEWIKMDRKCMALIRQWLEQNVYNHVTGTKTAKELWDKLLYMYERDTPGNRNLLVRRLMNLRYKDGTEISDYINEMQGILSQLSSLNMPLDDAWQACLLLNTLPESWEPLVISLNNSDKQLTFDLVSSCLLSEEVRRKTQQVTFSNSSQSLVSEYSSRGRSKSRNPSGRDKSRGRSKSRNKTFKCFYCDKAGHKKQYCYKYKKDLRNGKVLDNKSEDDKTTNVATEDILIILDEGNDCLTTNDDISWVIDSGASFHATPCKDFFNTYVTADLGVVKMGNNGTSNIVGHGDVHIVTNSGCKLVLKNVRHIPDLRLNLMSTGVLDDEGYVSQFSCGLWKLVKGSLVVAKGKKCGGLYMTTSSLVHGEVNVTSTTLTADLWHRRLGHMSEKGLEFLKKKNYLSQLDQTTLSSCDHCLAGKQSRASVDVSGKQNLLL